MSFAVAAEHLPDQLGLDWSYAWHLVLQQLGENRSWSVEEATLVIANEYGSIASCLPIEAKNLRVFCEGNRPADPLSWKPLNAAQPNEIVRHA